MVYDGVMGIRNLEVHLRAFVPADWDGLCRVYDSATLQELALAGVDLNAVRPMVEEETYDSFFAKERGIVACVDNQIVGFAAWQDGGYLSWLYVDPAFQRKGIGTKLLSQAMKSLGPQAWTLTKKGNTPAVILYQKFGMQIVKERQGQAHGYPHIELRLALPTSRRFDPNVPSFGA
jgi:ribosomal protein S18 acetylase RimI-like enzyme